MGVCNCSMFFCTLLYIHSSIAIILMGKRELIALLNLSFWCLVMVERLFLAVSRGSLQFVIVVFPDHTSIYLLFLVRIRANIKNSLFGKALFRISAKIEKNTFFGRALVRIRAKIAEKNLFGRALVRFRAK